VQIRRQHVFPNRSQRAALGASFLTPVSKDGKAGNPSLHPSVLNKAMLELLSTARLKTVRSTPRQPFDAVLRGGCFACWLQRPGARCSLTFKLLARPGYYVANAASKRTLLFGKSIFWVM